MRNFIKIFLRIISFPFIAGIILIAAIRNYFYTCWMWLSRGGQLNTYDDIFNPETIRQHFVQMKEAQFCGCNKDVKTGCTSAKHCNICGKVEQSETWLK